MACWRVFLCVDVAARRVYRQVRRALGSRLISIKNLYLLPDFIKESVFRTQILCTFQARFSGSMSANLCTPPPGEKPRALAAQPRASVPGLALTP